MYKITYKNGYIRYSKFPYGSYKTKNQTDEIFSSEKIIEEDKNKEDEQCQ